MVQCSWLFYRRDSGVAFGGSGLVLMNRASLKVTLQDRQPKSWNPPNDGENMFMYHPGDTFPPFSHQERISWIDDPSLSFILQCTSCVSLHIYGGFFHIYLSLQEGIDPISPRSPSSCWPVALSMVHAWYQEITNPGYDFDAATFKPGTGHFTQVVWKGRGRHCQVLVCGMVRVNGFKGRPTGNYGFSR